MFRVTDHFDVLQEAQEERELARKKWFIAAKENKHRKEIRQERIDEGIEDFASGMILADEVQLQNFETELETYDALTVEAIMENRVILERLYQERDAMLENAYMLEDGTRVFKSEDGQRVYDEHGKLVSSDLVHPDEIEDHFPKAEPYLDKLKLIEKHESIADRLAECQEKLDEAKARVQSGEMTQKELNEYRQELQQTMPIEVRRKLPDYDPTQETNAQAEFTKTASASVIPDSDMSIDASMVLTR